MDTKRWITIGVAALAALSGITLICINPLIGVFSVMEFLLGAIAGYFGKKEEIVTVEVPVEKVVKKVVYKKADSKKKLTNN